jgi:hypothetical protein
LFLIIRTVVLCVYFVDRCLAFCPFSFVHCVVCCSSIYGFWLPLWYLQTLPRTNKPQKSILYQKNMRKIRHKTTMGWTQVLEDGWVGSCCSTSDNMCIFVNNIFNYLNRIIYSNIFQGFDVLLNFYCWWKMHTCLKSVPEISTLIV